jgi:glycerol-3-phosphate dehydrogenase
MMNRSDMMQRIQERKFIWDIIVIGGGATGLGVAVEAASRGYQTLLLEQHDFSKGTSSRSTKLIHGGVRYLRQGNISLVIEALQERGRLIKNAPHLVHHQSFVVPAYDWWSGPFYGIGLKVYDLMAGKLGLGPSKMLSREETLERIPTLEPEGLRGGIEYYDGQFDDSRLALNLAQTACEQGAVVINYMPVSRLLKKNQLLQGVVAIDLEKEQEYECHSRAVINASGIFTDQILQMDQPDTRKLLTLSQGVHLILDREFLPGDTAVMVPHTDDGRVLFAVPWHQKVVVGTTDTPIEEAALEPRPLDQEIDFILSHAARYLSKDPSRQDILSFFAGIRPLVNLEQSGQTATISRDHFLWVSESGLVTITGGKWTTYRKMAEDTVNQAALVGGLEEKPSITENLKIHGWEENSKQSDPLSYYGSDLRSIKQLISKDLALGKLLHPRLPYPEAVVLWSMKQEMARSVEDILARRTRALLLDARASLEAAPKVADIMAEEGNYSQKWVEAQLKSYGALVKNYLPSIRRKW